MDTILTLLKESKALLTGHFLLSSGKHSDKYVQCAKLLQHPDKAAKACKVIAQKLKDVDVDVICGPAMGGIIVAYELGRQLQKPAIFTERVDNKMALRRGFEILKGQKVLIAEDVVTTGVSSMETKKVIEEMGGEVIGIACIVNRSGREEVGLPLYYGTKIDIQTFDPDDVPEWLAEIPVAKPGSRKMKA